MHRHTARKSRVHVYISNKTLLIFFFSIFKDVDDEQNDVWGKEKKKKKKKKEKGKKEGGGRGRGAGAG